MIEISTHEEVTEFKMSRELDGKPVYWVASYLVDGLLIDTGCSYTAEELVEELDGRELTMVVNTHYHEDHVGANRLIETRFDVPMFAHPDSVPLINQRLELNPYQELVWGYPEPTSVEQLGVSVETEHFHFDVIETRGHCEGHVVLVEPDKGWCFSGDIYITERPKVIRADEDAAGLMESMRMLAELPTERLVLFTSMGEVIPDGRQALLSCLEYFENLQSEVKVLSDKGLSPVEIRQNLFGEGSSLAALTGGHFSTDNLVTSLLAAT